MPTPITVSVNFIDLTGSAITGYMEAAIVSPSGVYDLYVTGTGIIAPKTVTSTKGTSVSVDVWGNDVVVDMVDGAKDTYYTINLFNSSNVLIWSAAYLFTGAGPINLVGYPSLTILPPVPTQSQPQFFTPAGNNGDVQFNNSGLFGGTDGLIWADPVLSLKGTLSLIGTSGSASIGVASAAGTPNKILLPITTGTSGQALITDGANPQQLSWASASSILAAGSSTDVQINLSGKFYGDGNFTYTPTGTPTIAITGNLTQTGLVQITGPASAGTNPLTVISSDNGPTNVLGSVLAMTNSGGSSTTAYIVKGADNSLIIRNDGAAIAVKGVLGFLADGTAEMLAGTNGAQFQMNTVAGALPAGSVAWALPLSGVGTARFHIGSPTPGFSWDWDGGTGEMFQTAAHGETAGTGFSSEEITLSLAGVTTDSSTNLLPAGAIIDSVTARVTQTISGGSTPTTWEAGDPTTAARFISTGNALTAGTTAIGLNQMQGSTVTDAAGPVQPTAAKVRITLDQIPGQGKVRVTVFWRQFTAPTS